MKVQMPDRDPDFIVYKCKVWIDEMVIHRHQLYFYPEKLYIDNENDELYVVKPPSEGAGGRLSSPGFTNAYREWVLEKELLGGYYD